MLNLGLFASPAAARAPSSSQPAAPEGDAGPTHKKNLKIIALAVLIESGISGGIFYGAWENAQIFAASNPVFMLLAPFLCVVLEFIKVPVGVCSQTHPSAAKRALAAFVLLLAATSTAINAVPIFAKLWKPQLAVVRQDAENLAVAESNEATFDKKMQAAKDAKAAAEGVYKEAQASRRTASAGVGKAAAKSDARAKRTDLSAARTDVGDAKKKFDDASAALGKFDAKKTDDAVRDAESALRAARQASTLHWIYGAATGAEVSSVADKELAPVLIGAVGLPSALVAAISSLLSVLGVSAIARPKAPAPAPEAKPEPVLVVDEPVWDTMTDFVRQEEEARAAKEAEAKAKAKRLREDAKLQKAFAKTEAARRTASNDNSPSRKSRPSQKDGDNEATS